MLARAIKLATSLVLLIGLSSFLMTLDLHAQEELVEDETPFIFGGLAWSPDGDVLAVGTSDGIWLHAVDDLSVIAQFTAHSAISSLDWSPDGKRLISGNSAGVVQVWDAETGMSLRSLRGHALAIASVK